MRIAIDRRKGKAATISLKPIIVTEYASATVFTYATISLTLFEMGTLSRDSTMMVESIKGNERLVGKVGKDRHMNIDYKLKAFERVQSYRV